MTDKELMKAALEALTYVGDAKEIYSDTIETLRARLEQPEPEPVLRGTDYEATFYQDWNAGRVKRVSDGKRMVPEREWVGLTDDEVDDIGCDFATLGGDIESKNWFAFYLAIEAKLKEKNT
jgi:hypothetical protein